MSIKNKSIITKRDFRPIYLGYFLTESDSKELVSIAQQFIDTNVVYGKQDADHVTALFSPFKAILVSKLLELPETINVSITELYYTQKIAAFKVQVSPKYIFNDNTPHITTFLMPNVRPVESNDLFPKKDENPEEFYQKNSHIKKVVIPRKDITLFTGIFNSKNSQNGGDKCYIDYTI